MSLSTTTTQCHLGRKPLVPVPEQFLQALNTMFTPEISVQRERGKGLVRLLDRGESAGESER